MLNAKRSKIRITTNILLSPDNSPRTKKQCQKSGYNVPQVLVVSNDFSDDFISECEYEYELDISLITSVGLVRILEGFKESHMKEFPVRLLMKDGLLNEDRIVKVLGG